MNWLQTFPSTNVRIVITLLLAIGTAVRYLAFGLAAGSQAGWNSWLIFVAVMAGIDASQYLGKRFSDTGYATAKNTSAPPVNVSTPSVVVAPDATSAPINVDNTARFRTSAPVARDGVHNEASDR